MGTSEIWLLQLVRLGMSFGVLRQDAVERPKASVTFRVTLLLGVQQRGASLQRAPVAGVPCLLALSKSSLNGVLGVECSNHSVPTILFNDLAQLSRVGLFHVRDFCVTSPNFTPASSSESSAPAHASQWLTPYLQLLSVAPALPLSSDW